MIMKQAIVIGHDHYESGAYSKWLHKSEFTYNSEVAEILKCQLGTQIDIYNRPANLGGYKTKMRKLTQQINAQKYGLVVELHFNSFDGTAHGVETVSWEGNTYTKGAGEIFCQMLHAEFDSKIRGAKTVTAGNENQRGYWFLQMNAAPAMILEPFFGDNKEATRFENPARYATILGEFLMDIR